MANEGKLKVGVIGVGALGRHHARLYNLSENAEVVGIFDTVGATARAVGEEFGLKVYDTWQKLAADCDALSVAVPATYHHAMTIPLLEMKKHVLVEKPIAASVEEAEAMVAAAKANNVVLAVGPEGGFNDFEEALLQSSGFRPVTLGRRILRSEFAVNSILTLLGGC